MSTASGTFVSLSGETYSVELTGSSILSSETLTFSGRSPVTIGYRQGSVKFCGLRTVTATISIVASKDMSYLYSSSPTGTSVIISRYDSGSRAWINVFTGYLVPFVYSSPYQLDNDVIELQAVDAISAHKDEPFQAYSRPVSKSAIEYIFDICAPMGITRFICADCFSRSNSISSLGHNLENIDISSTAFLPSDFAHEPVKLTVTEVLNSIIRFFGLTGVLWGDELYLFDQYAMTEAPSVWYHSTAYEYDSRYGTYTSQDYTSTLSPLWDNFIVAASDFRAADARHNVEQAYGVIQLSPDDRDKMLFLADPLKSDVVDGDVNINGETSGFYVYRQVLSEADIECQAYRMDGTQLTLQSFIDNPNLLGDGVAANIGWCGAVPIRCQAWNTNQDYTGASSKKFIWLHHQGMNVGVNLGVKRLFSVKPKCTAIMDGRMFRFRCSVCYSTVNGQFNYLPPIYNQNAGSPGPMSPDFLYLQVGSQFYHLRPRNPIQLHYNEGMWDTVKTPCQIMFGSEDAHGMLPVQNSYRAMVEFDTGWIDAGHDGQLSLYWDVPLNGDDGVSLLNVWLTDLSIEVFGRSYDEADFRFPLENGISEELSVGCGLVRSYGDLKSVVSGSFVNSYLARSSSSSSDMDPAGVLLTQLQGRYAVKHDAYELTLLDGLKPWTLVAFQNSDKTIDAMTWDLYDSTMRILID